MPPFDRDAIDHEDLFWDDVAASFGDEPSDEEQREMDLDIEYYEGLLFDDEPGGK